MNGYNETLFRRRASSVILCQKWVYPVKKKGFTLIELLVVIAIIALLLSIVLPAFRSAKEKARDVICRTRCKSIGMAIQAYLSEFEYRAFNNRQTNGHLWYDAAGNLITPNNASWWSDAYWALGYRAYAADEKVFSCPSFVLKNAADLLYSGNTNYKTTKTDMTHAAGFGLNSYFFLDPEAAATDINRYHRKINTLKFPSRFIVAHDHVEPKMEGDSGGNEQGDMFYVPAGGSYNLTQYRTGNRQIHYTNIFRHSKRSKLLDEPSQLAARIPLVNGNPNGNANVLFADGSADKIMETTGQNIPKSMYKGQN